VLQHDASDSWLECNEFKEMVALDERPTPDGVHRLLTDFIATTINDVGMHQVDSIGLGFPGEVDPSAGMVISSYGGYDSHDPFMENLAVRLAEVHSIVRALIGETSESHEAVCRRLTEKLYLDNDANCAARGTLAKHHADQSWQDFAVVVIGTGVGAGFVLDRHVYFGSAGAAGEIGHTTIGSLGGGVASHLACACHRDAGVVHWEALVSGGGLVAYLRQRAPELYGRLTGMIDRLPEAKDLFQLVRADTSGAQPMQDAAPYREVMADRNLRELVYEVLTTHADCVAEGLANLINLLNLDHVVLSGGVMDGLMSLHRYRQHLQASLQPRLLESTEKVFAGIDWHFTLRQSAGWQGAALLELDTAYQGRLGRRLLAPGAPG
jgi:predicted NBD/HSP70 family sugar kinase